MNLVDLLVKNKIKVVIIILMCYQLIDLTFKYREYKTIIKSEIKTLNQWFAFNHFMSQRSQLAIWRKEIVTYRKSINEASVIYSFQYLDKHINETSQFWQITILIRSNTKYSENDEYILAWQIWLSPTFITQMHHNVQQIQLNSSNDVINVQITNQRFIYFQMIQEIQIIFSQFILQMNYLH